jgi:hypothetical protein
MPAPADPAIVARAEELLRGGAAPADVAEQTGLSERTVYRLRAGLASEATPTTGSTSTTSAPTPTTTSTTTGSTTPEAPGFDVPPIPPELTDPAAIDAWILSSRIDAVRALLHQAQARIASGGSAHGLAALEGVLARLLAQRAAVRPPAPPSADEEERAHRADAARVVATIEAGVGAVEEATKSALRAGLARWPGAAERALEILFG